MKPPPPFFVMLLFNFMPAFILSVLAILLLLKARAQRRPFNFSLLELLSASAGMFPAAAWVAMYFSEPDTNKHHVGLAIFSEITLCAPLGMLVAKLWYESRRVGLPPHPKRAALAIILGAIAGYFCSILGLMLFGAIFIN